MSKLSKLYSMISNAEELGIELGEHVYKQTDQLEEELIKKEILPVIKDSIEPTLQQIKRDLTLVVDYVPGASVEVRISRKAKIYKEEDFVVLTTDPQVEHKTHKGSSSTARAAKTGLRVIRNDGSVIQEKTAALTLVSAIKEAGPVNVRNMNIICCKVPLVSTTKDAKYGATQVRVSPKLYVITHSNNMMKKGFLEKISRNLGLGWKVEIIK